MTKGLPIPHNNSTDDNYDFYLLIINDPAYWLSLAVVGFLLSAVIVVANFVLLLVIYKDPRRALRTPPCFLIVNLGASDFLLGCTVVLLVAVRDVYRYHQVPMPSVAVMKAVMYTILTTTLFVSSNTIIAMSGTCFVAINNPIDYKVKITKKRIKIFIALVWLLSLLMCFLPVANVSEKTFTLIYLHTHASIPAILLTVIYIKVFRALGRRTQELKLNGMESILKSRQSLEREKNMMITIVIVLAMFYITFIPQFITLHLLYFCTTCQGSITFHKIDVVLSRFLFLNSAINPFIYAWRWPRYHQALIDCWKILKSKCGFGQPIDPENMSFTLSERQRARESQSQGNISRV